MVNYETHDPHPRQREDVDEAIRKMSESIGSSKQPVVRRLMNFQVFVSMLLVVLVIITTMSFAFTMRSERESRELAEHRRELFEAHVADILFSIQQSQDAAHTEREEIYQELLTIHNEMIDALNEVLEGH